ncbi:hypothetical protein BGW80DRAFT_1462735 [Lactifluus volemus]|nr:hypothetical protein BGW80DRAFT_1462735 [Lactifluus volemus]
MDVRLEFPKCDPAVWSGRTPVTLVDERDRTCLRSKLSMDSPTTNVHALERKFKSCSGPRATSDPDGTSVPTHHYPSSYILNQPRFASPQTHTPNSAFAAHGGTLGSTYTGFTSFHTPASSSRRAIPIRALLPLSHSISAHS